MASPSNGGVQETLFLPLRLLNGWLFGIDDRRVKDPAAREKIVAYKRECHAVLYEHFMPQHAELLPVPLQAGQADAACPAPGPWTQPAQVINAQVRVISEARAVYGAEAARSLWAQSGLPQVAEDRESALTADPQGCLAHLLRYAAFGRSTVADLIDDALRGGGDDYLAELGIRVNPDSHPNRLAVAYSGRALMAIYAATEWREGGWHYGLLGLPGARVQQNVDFNGRSRRAVLIPISASNSVKRYERKRA